MIYLLTDSLGGQVHITSTDSLEDMRRLYGPTIDIQPMPAPDAPTEPGEPAVIKPSAKKPVK